MKSTFALFIVLSVFLLSSCIKDESMFREADMESFDLNDSIYVMDTPARESIINVIVSDTTGTLTKSFTPIFTISNGATANPKSGETVTFENYTKDYTITSEDGGLQQKFIVHIVQIVPLNTGFEEWRMAGALWKYPAMEDNLWDSANQGISIATLGRIEEYPTTWTTDSYAGEYAAKLETKKGGTYWGQKIPIFSGSLFRGKFALNATDFVKSAMFGQPHPQYMGRPEAFKGYFKYQPGDVFLNENGDEVEGLIDECSIYSVFYKVEKNDISNDSYLNAFDVLTSERIIAKAIVTDTSEKSEYTEFFVPYEYTEEPDYERYDYRLAVVLASSKEGDFYRGAVGSTLIIDDVEVVCEY